MKYLRQKPAQRIVKPHVMNEIPFITAFKIDENDLFKDPHFVYLAGLDNITF